MNRGLYSRTLFEGGEREREREREKERERGEGEGAGEGGWGGGREGGRKGRGEKERERPIPLRISLARAREREIREIHQFSLPPSLLPSLPRDRLSALLIVLLLLLPHTLQASRAL